MITFPTTGGGSWNTWYRFLAVNHVPMMEVGNICDTCGFWFRRLEGASDGSQLDELHARLTSGLDRLDPAAIERFGELLEAGQYTVMLQAVVPLRVEPGSPADYFVHEQPRDWSDYGSEPPTDPRTAYYRTEGRQDAIINTQGDRLFEFVVPLQNPTALDPERVAFFQDRLTQGDRATAVAVGILDVKQFYDSAAAHWCFAHFLLDGHHKLEAAARTGTAVTLLSFVSRAAGVAPPEAIDSLLQFLNHRRPS